MNTLEKILISESVLTTDQVYEMEYRLQTAICNENNNNTSRIANIFSPWFIDLP